MIKLNNNFFVVIGYLTHYLATWTLPTTLPWFEPATAISSSATTNNKIEKTFAIWWNLVMEKAILVSHTDLQLEPIHACALNVAG